ncbi:MAG: hypothetical protein LQ350_004302 [Teloschistes chrysophthalmus]|nr:MAG: hypothetical protein LQ350_004302 [Niorma chrysophthalma]
MPHDSPIFYTSRDVTSPSLTATSQSLVTPSIDPEDRIFDSSSDSGTSQNHNREDHQEPRWAHLHDQVRDLRRNIDDLRHLASGVNRTTPSANTRSQTSDLLEEFALLRRQLAGMEQQYSDQLQDLWSSQTVEDGATTDDNSNTPDPIHNLQSLHGNQANRTLNDGDLQRRIDTLREEADRNRLQSYLIDRAAHEPYSVNAHRVRAQLQRAEHERLRRAGPVPVFGTREEVDRQGPAYESPLSSLFRQEMPAPYDASDVTRQHRNRAAGNPWTGSNVTEAQGGSPGRERVEARHPNNHVAAGQSGALPNGSTAPSYLNTSSAFLQQLRNQNALQRRYLNRPGGPWASDPPASSYFPSSNVGHEHHTAQEDTNGTGLQRNSNHPRHPSPQATSGTRDETHEDVFFRLHAPPNQPRLLPSQQPYEMQTTAAYMQYRQANEVHMQQVRFLQERQRPAASLDNDTTRPGPLSEEAKMVKMECKICFAQISNHVILPCGHCCLCKWCCDQLFPRAPTDRTRPADRNAACPMCRKKVKSIVEMYAG